MPLTIHGSVLSPFTRKVTLIALEKNLTFESKDLNPFAPPPNFRDLSPLKRIPVLEDGDYTLSDSSAIAGYLEAAYPKNPLFPTQAKALGRALWIEEFADTVLAVDVGLGVFRPVIVHPMMGKPTDHDILKEAVAIKIPRRLTYLNEQLRDKEWFIEERFGIADIAVYAHMMSLVHAGYMPDAARYPALLALCSRIQERDSARALFEKECAYLDRIQTMMGLK